MAIVFLRTLIVYFTLLITMRLLGKRQLGEMELSEFVLAALIADLAAHPLQDLGIPMINGLAPVLTLFCCEILISCISMKSIRIRSILFGKPSILIRRGKINQKEMEKNRFTSDELMQNLRNLGCLDISHIEYAILETDGQLNVVKYPSEQPVTAGQMNVPTGDAGYPLAVISSGRIIDENLSFLSKDRQWLHHELEQRGIKDAKDVYLMLLNEGGQIYLARKEKNECSNVNMAQ